MSDGVNVAAFLPRSRANGPGERAVVWVQGCPRPVCPGCWNPAFLDVNHEATRVSVPDLAARILALDGLDGVTFSGGEPFHQAAALANGFTQLCWRRRFAFHSGGTSPYGFDLTR